MKKSVKEVMSSFTISLNEDATLSEAVHIMVNKNVGRLPVLSGTKFLGMIRLIEIFEEIKKVILAQ